MYTAIKVKPNNQLRELVPSITPAGNVFYFDPATSRGSKPLRWLDAGEFEVIGTAPNFLEAVDTTLGADHSGHDVHIMAPGMATVSRLGRTEAGA